jgi:nitroreductase
MELIEVLKKRRSTRKFLDKEIPDTLINGIIELANSSPSAGNVQARAVVVIRDQKIIEKIKNIASGLIRFESVIPILLVILAKPDESAIKYKERGKNLYALQDATIFAAYLQLLAVEKGLSTCWVGSFREEQVAEILKLPNGVRPVAMIPLGHGAEQPAPGIRKSLKEIILKEV